MSRIGTKPIDLPSNVKAEVKGNTVSVNGPKGQLSWSFAPALQVSLEDNRILVKRPDDRKQNRALHGLTRALIANMVHGVNHGYQRRLLIYGTGYSCTVKGQNLDLNIGFMGRSINKGPQFSIPIPKGIEVVVETPAARGDNEPARLLVKGIDKQLVGEFAAEVRSLRTAEPYKGKGIRYENEHVRRKQGKALTSGG